MMVVIVEGEDAVLGVNLGSPIETNGGFVSCAEVREPMELSFSVMNGVGPGTGVMY